ncbi:MAG: NAD(P)(+) transhydrogenase (Re/Si-specific) subunit beta [Planctomycetota bacterium]
MTIAWDILLYLLCAVGFIVGIKGLTHPRSAVRGNLSSASAMLLAIVVTLFVIRGGHNWFVIVPGILIGGAAGAVMATRVQMTAMPQMVAAFNGFGGVASVFVAGAAVIGLDAVYSGAAEAAADFGVEFDPALPWIQGIAIALTGLIGGVTFSGSGIAYGKLDEWKIFWKDTSLPANQLINAGLLVAALVVGSLVTLVPSLAVVWYALLVVIALALGLTLVLPIGGADMPVVIALLNSYSGLAAAKSGFVIGNTVLIVSGSLVGASGLILTAIMCRAMNRSLTNVLFGKIDASGAKADADEVYGGRVKSTSAEEVAMLLDDADRVVIVPGYGMAVSQAQHAVRDLYKELSDRGKTVEFAVHPVAGRMPGHMNVLLAEVDIPYDRLLDDTQTNSTIETADVAIVLGANDVVNPDARENPQSPIAGMPIIDVDKARTVIVIKRSLSPGFAGIPNPLFAADNTLMFFGDGKKAVVDMVAEVKDL